MLINDHANDLFKQINFSAKLIEYQVPSDIYKVDPTTVNLISTAMGSLDETAEYINDRLNDSSIELTSKIKDDLYFSAVYFDNLISSKRYRSESNTYFYLLGALAYYFCDRIGSSKVMLSFVTENVDVDGGGFEKLLWLILSNKLDTDNIPKIEKFDDKVSIILNEFFLFKENGKIPNFNRYRVLNDEVLDRGTDREAFLCELFVALLKFKILNSAVYLLPKYTNLSLKFWLNKLNGGNCISELWPSQKLLGKEGLFNGKSGVIQLPTSSGKTTSICILLQSQFKRNPDTNAMVIAPYRALCKDITKDLSFYFKNDPMVLVTELFDGYSGNIINLNKNNTVYVFTPEKMFSLLRKNPDILGSVSTIIFDEAHLFDDNSRGAMYELLIATVKKLVLPDTQLVLMSAVLPNITDVNKWINGKTGVEISSNSLKNIGTRKSIAIENFNSNNNGLLFLDANNPNKENYFIPRVISQHQLKRIGRERKVRIFPDFNSSKDIAIELATCLIHNGPIAIFCGRKSTVRGIIARVADLKSHGFDFSDFIKVCKNNENEKIKNLMIYNFGRDSDYVKVAKLGIFPHSAEIPLGMRNSIEYAISEKLIGLVVCTSTLAQGVNLPIKYLIILSLYQSKNPLSVRIFQNLIGRVGRAGKYTEGTVILSDPTVYKTPYKYKMYKAVLDNSNLELCKSTLLRLVSPLYVGNIPLSSENFYKFLITKYKDRNRYDSELKELQTVIKNKYSNKFLNEFNDDIENINKILSALENYIINYSSIFQELDSVNIAKDTLGYFQASDDQKEKLVSLVQAIINNIDNMDIQEIQKITRTSCGIFDGKKLLNLANVKKDNLLNAKKDTEIIELTILDIMANSKNSIVKKVNSKNILKKICVLWIEGKSYYEIFIECKRQNFVIKSRKSSPNIKLEEIVEICNNFLSYEYSYFIDELQSVIGENDSVLNLFQEKLKYGLSDRVSILVYELGFSDRYIAQLVTDEISNEFDELENKDKVIQAIKLHKQKLKEILLTYPTYFEKMLENICNIEIV